MARVEENGLLAIPKEAQEELGLQPGDEVILSLHRLAAPHHGGGKSKKAVRSHPRNNHAERPSILGKYAGIIPSSEEFMQEKQREIAREEEGFRR